MPYRQSLSALALLAAMLASPARAAGSAGGEIVWVSLCTGHGELRNILVVRRDGKHPDPDAKACHAIVFRCERKRHSRNLNA